MTDKDPKSEKQGSGRHGGAIALLFVVAVAAVAWFWMTRQPAQQAGIGIEHGVIVVGAGALVTAVIAYIREMDVTDVLELLGELAMGLFAVIGAILKGIGNWILGLFGWD